MATTVLLTAEELAELPDDARGELVDGVMLPMTPAQGDQWNVVGNLNHYLWAFIKPNNLGRIGPERGYKLRANPDTVLAPDISYVAAGRDIPDAAIRGFVPIAPDLAVEVMSPTNTYPEMLQRTAIYLEAGVRLVWIVDPARQRVTVHAPDGDSRILEAGDELDGGDVLPGFTLALADLFA